MLSNDDSKLQIKPWKCFRDTTNSLEMSFLRGRLLLNRLADAQLKYVSKVGDTYFSHFVNQINDKIYFMFTFSNIIIRRSPKIDDLAAIVNVKSMLSRLNLIIFRRCLVKFQFHLPTATIRSKTIA